MAEAELAVQACPHQMPPACTIEAASTAEGGRSLEARAVSTPLSYLCLLADVYACGCIGCILNSICRVRV